MHKLPVAEALVAVLASGETQKLKTIIAALGGRYTPDQAERGIRNLLADGRIRRVRSGYYSFVSPFDVPAIEAPLEGRIFDLILQIASRPTLFEGLARWHRIPRCSLWHCLCALTQQGRLRMIVDCSDGQGVRFVTVGERSENISHTAFDLRDVFLRGPKVYKLTEIAKSANLSSRMILNRLKRLDLNGSMASFCFLNQRYIVGTTNEWDPSTNVSLIFPPAQVDSYIEFGDDLHQILINATLGFPIHSADKQALRAVLSGLIRPPGQHGTDQLTYVGRLLIGTF